MQIHDWKVASSVSIYFLIGMESHNYVYRIVHCMNLLQKVQMTSMKKVESASDVNDLVARARVFWGRKLHDFVVCLQELIDTCPRRRFCVVLSRETVYSSSLRLVFFRSRRSQITRRPLFG